MRKGTGTFVDPQTEELASRYTGLNNGAEYEITGAETKPTMDRNRREEGIGVPGSIVPRSTYVANLQSTL